MQCFIIMKFKYTILYVEDVKKTIEFYKEAFGFELKFITSEEDYAEIETGETTLSFAYYSVAKFNEIKMSKSTISEIYLPFELTFVTLNIQDDFQRVVNSGAKIIKEPSQKPWGQIVGYVQDINGFLIEICTPVKE